MVDLRNAKEALENYLDGYERENDKVKLKIIHTYGVVECSRKIAEGLKLSEEDCKLAQIIGLLHDIGRFEQLKCYDSFEPETMNHAAYGVKILFEERIITMSGNSHFDNSIPFVFFDKTPDHSLFN